jgi:hypothetical protein
VQPTILPNHRERQAEAPCAQPHVLPNPPTRVVVSHREVLPPDRAEQHDDRAVDKLCGRCERKRPHCSPSPPVLTRLGSPAGSMNNRQPTGAVRMPTTVDRRRGLTSHPDYVRMLQYRRSIGAGAVSTEYLCLSLMNRYQSRYRNSARSCGSPSSRDVRLGQPPSWRLAREWFRRTERRVLDNLQRFSRRYWLSTSVTSVSGPTSGTFTDKPSPSTGTSTTGAVKCWRCGDWVKLSGALVSTAMLVSTTLRPWRLPATSTTGAEEPTHCGDWARLSGSSVSTARPEQ